MTPIAPTISRAEFTVLAKRAGLSLSEAQGDTIFEVYGHFEAMLERLRGTAERSRGAEPSHVFVPGQGWGL